MTKKKDEQKNWCVYIEGMLLPWEDGLLKSDAEEYAEAFRTNGITSKVQQLGYSEKTRVWGGHVSKM